MDASKLVASGFGQCSLEPKQVEEIFVRSQLNQRCLLCAAQKATHARRTLAVAVGFSGHSLTWRNGAETIVSAPPLSSGFPVMPSLVVRPPCPLPQLAASADDEIGSSGAAEGKPERWQIKTIDTGRFVNFR